MAEPKYKIYFDLMFKQNKEAFEEFKKLNDNFTLDPKKFKTEFNEKGREIQDIVRYWENRLCGKSEGSGYSKFSANLAEKFQYEVKRHFPKFDFIGLE
jgi:hypothetical protein